MKIKQFTSFGKPLEEGFLLKTKQAIKFSQDGNFLTLKEITVLENRLGLNGKTPQTFDEVALLFGVTRERIRQIQEKAFEKIKHYK